MCEAKSLPQAQESALAECSSLGSSCSGDRRWKLSLAAVLGLVLWVAANILLATAILDHQKRQEVHHEDSAPLVFSSVVVRFIAVILTGIGAASYIHVSRREPRPFQLHIHGVLLLLMLPELVGAMVADTLHHSGSYAWSRASLGLAYGIWGVRRVLFFLLLVQKMLATGPPLSRCGDVRLWGGVLIASTLVVAFVSGGPLFAWSAVRLARGASYEDVEEVYRAGNFWSPNDCLSMAERIILGLLFNLGIACALTICFASLAFILVARRVVRASFAKMVQRHVTGKLLAQVRCTLMQHLLGIVASLASNILVISANLLDGLGCLGEDVEDAIVSGAHFVDAAGDIVGILLLSGIGVLLFREQPDAGDINGHIRGVLHSAVLTSRADIVFEGHVAVTRSNRCIASFPGKFMPEWNALTWLCEQGDLSSACVFLPTSDPQHRFGQHASCPETPGECWCYSLYGERKPWGCLWFDAWRSNIEKAIRLQLDLVVVFFPGQAGKGQVRWEELRTADLWNNVGLGGSQKAEVAYLKKRGFKVIEEDLEATRLQMSIITPT